MITLPLSVDFIKTTVSCVSGETFSSAIMTAVPTEPRLVGASFSLYVFLS